jgi:hypothetical protein
MIKLCLSLVILSSALAASAQTVLGASVTLNNYTSCDYYVTLESVDPCCSMGTDIVVFVPSGGMGYTATAPAGMRFEVARISDTYPSPTSYQVKIQTPNAATGWIGAPCLACYQQGSYPQCDAMVHCLGLPTESCWNGSAASPVIDIVN